MPDPQQLTQARPVQWKDRILEHVAAHPGRSTTELATALGATSRNISRFLTDLRRSGKLRVEYVRKLNANRIYLAHEESGWDEED